MTSPTLRCLIGLLALVLSGGTAAAAPQRTPPPVPDLTAGGVPDDTHDWNLGATGARGWMWGWRLSTERARQILVTEVAEGSPADGVLRPGDVIVGAAGAPFDRDARRALADALVDAEETDGELVLLRWRERTEQAVPLELPVLGTHDALSPFDCERSALVLGRACAHIEGHMKGSIDGMMNALALLAAGRAPGPVVELAREVARESERVTLEGRTSGLFAWRWGYRLLFLCEVQLALGSEVELMPAIATYAGAIARGQSGVGTWGHGMAWPDLNDGELHGRLGGYGALNQSALVCHLGLVLARRAGLKDPEVDRAIQKANGFFRFYAGKGSIPYGDHRPGARDHDDNGKNSLAAIVFDLQGMDEEVRFFGRMTVASHGERELGHTGNYFSLLWGALGAARLGPEALAAFQKEQRWVEALARTWEGAFVYQGGAGQSGGEHKYAGWDCTGAFALALTAPEARLFITGKGARPGNSLGPAEAREAIALGEGFDPWSKGDDFHRTLDEARLLDRLGSWSPAVRTRAARALGARDEAPVAALLRRLEGADPLARQGAMAALGEVGRAGAPAVPALRQLLGHDDPWIAAQAAHALAGIGAPALAAADDMLGIAAGADPDGTLARALCFCLFYKGGALGGPGLLGRSLEGADPDLLTAAIETLLRCRDGRARGAVGQAFRLMSDAALEPLLPAIVEAVRTPSPSGVMFSNGVRIAGLDVLARLRVREGVDLCIDVTEIDEWGKQGRIKGAMEALRAYGAEARPVLPRLHDLAARLRAHREARNLEPLAVLCEETAAYIEEAPPRAPLRDVQREGSSTGVLRVYLLAGQSNMSGHGFVPAVAKRGGGRGSLEAAVRGAPEGTRLAALLGPDGEWIEHDRVWVQFFERIGPLRPGFGARKDRIGPELGFGWRIAEHEPGPVLLLKVAQGGKSLAVDFRPPSAGGEVGPWYRRLVDEARRCLAEDGGGIPELADLEPELAGVAWHHGWNDRIDQAFNDAYEHNLCCLIRDLRRDLDAPELPVVIAETGMCGPEESHPRALSLMRAQAAVAAREEFRGTVSFVGTRSFWRPEETSPTGQGYHWNGNAETYMDIGLAMAEAMAGLLGRNR